MKDKVDIMVTRTKENILDLRNELGLSDEEAIVVELSLLNPLNILVKSILEKDEEISRKVVFKMVERSPATDLAKFARENL